MPDQMHSDSAEATRPTGAMLCPVDGAPFTPKRPWQKFCSDRCRSTWHQSMTPEALRKDLDALRAAVDALAAGNAALSQRVDELEAAVAKVPA
jgi:hypothetical protein